MIKYGRQSWVRSAGDGKAGKGETGEVESCTVQGTVPGHVAVEHIEQASS